MSEHGVDRDTSAAAAAAAAAAVSGGTATGNAAVIVGISSATDNALVRWDGTSGILVQDSSATLSDAGALTLAAGITATTGSYSGQITSTVTTGTAPLVVASTTVVANLNADLLDGVQGSAFLLIADIDDTPVNGVTNAPISSNWAYDHENGADPHTMYVLTSEIGSAVQAWDANLDQIAALAVTDSNIIVGNGSAWVAESGATARTSLGVGTGDSPQFTGIELGHASDTTLTRAAAGVVAAEGKNLSRISSQAGAPSSTPSYIGELNIDTTSAKAYIATGVASSADWEQIDGTGGGSGASSDITQTTHGFAVGNPIYYTGSAYAKAKADAVATAEVVGIVSAVAGANDFTLLFVGPVTGLSGLTAGSVYFLSADTAGAMTATEPTTVGQISKPIFVAYSTTAGYFFNMRGVTVGSATSTMAQSITSGDGSTTAFTLPATPVHENNVLVFISGVWQQRDTYSVSGATLTFSTAPPTGTSNIEFIVIGSVSIGTASATDAGATLTLGTAQATTSGTNIDFTGIPAGTKHIIVSLAGVSTNGSSVPLIQIGSSAGVLATGYLGTTSFIPNAASPTTTVWPGAGVQLTSTGGSAATSITSGRLEATLLNGSTNGWIFTWSGANNTSSVVATHHGAGDNALPGALDRVRLTTTSGDTFDAGSINIAYK